MIDFSYRHIATHRAGSPGYYEPLLRGHVQVRHDQQRFIYDLRGNRKPREFRAWVKRLWIDDHNGNTRHLSGRYPTYTVD